MQSTEWKGIYFLLGVVTNTLLFMAFSWNGMFWSEPWRFVEDQSAKRKRSLANNVTGSNLLWHPMMMIQCSANLVKSFRGNMFKKLISKYMSIYISSETTDGSCISQTKRQRQDCGIHRPKTVFYFYFCLCSGIFCLCAYEYIVQKS